MMKQITFKLKYMDLAKLLITITPLNIMTGLLDIYISSVSNRMNEIMKVLTVFASIFVPLTFIVGIYGMNFEYMPELKWKWSYPALWVFFVIFTILSLRYYRKKNWL